MYSHKLLFSRSYNYLYSVGFHLSFCNVFIAEIDRNIEKHNAEIR